MLHENHESQYVFHGLDVNFIQHALFFQIYCDLQCNFNMHIHEKSV